MGPNDVGRAEIAFFDLETTVPTCPGQGYAILEFGSILVCSKKLVELRSYSTLVRPSDLCLISKSSVRCNGITRDAVVQAPCFSEVADEVYDLLHGRIWAGHNIVRFDCKRIQEAFAEIGRPAPEPKGTIDSLALLTQRFGRRAGDMKMASLATYFGLGQQTHRSLDDVRMNLEILKYCSTVLFLESSLPEIFTEKSWVSPNATTRSRGNGKTSPPNGVSTINTSPSFQTNGNDESPANQIVGESHPILSLLPSTTEDTTTEEASKFEDVGVFDLASLATEIKTEQLQEDFAMEDKLVSLDVLSEGCSGYARFLDPEEVSIPSIRACLVPVYRGIQRIRLLHSGLAFQLCSTQLKVRFGISTKYLDAIGRPRLSFVVDATEALCDVLDTCDQLVEKLSTESGSSSKWWRVVVSRRNGFMCSPTLRLHIPTVNSNGPRYETEMYKKESSGKQEKLVFSQCNAAEVAPLLNPGTTLDAYFSLDHYDYHQNAGIRLVAKKLVIHC